jgi:hypothetical protein
MSLWTQAELHLAADADLKMLKYQQNDTPYKKSEMSLELQGKIERSRSSIDMRFQNISCVLDSHKLPYVTGYLPPSNVGRTNAEKIWKLIQQLQTR